MLQINNILFSKEDLDFEQNGGEPVVLSSFQGIQIFDSYIVTKNNEEYKLYKPTPSNLLLSYKASLIINKEKYLQINSLINEQAAIVKDYRLSRNTDNLQGWRFLYKNGEIDSKVWLTSFSRENSYFEYNGEMKIKCSLEVQEAE